MMEEWQNGAEGLESEEMQVDEQLDAAKKREEGEMERDHAAQGAEEGTQTESRFKLLSKEDDKTEEEEETEDEQEDGYLSSDDEDTQARPNHQIPAQKTRAKKAVTRIWEKKDEEWSEEEDDDMEQDEEDWIIEDGDAEEDEGDAEEAAEMEEEEEEDEYYARASGKKGRRVPPHERYEGWGETEEKSKGETNRLNFATLNTRALNNQKAVERVVRHMDNNNIYLAVFQETMIAESTYTFEDKSGKYRMYHQCDGSRGKGDRALAIAVRNGVGIHLTILSSSIHHQAAALEIENSHQKFALVNLYLPLRKHEAERRQAIKSFTKAIQEVRSERPDHQIIVGGDFNANADNVDLMLAEEGLEYLNEDKTSGIVRLEVTIGADKTTHKLGTVSRSRAIDHILYSHGCLRECRVLHTASHLISDHYAKAACRTHHATISEHDIRAWQTDGRCENLLWPYRAL